MAAACPSPSPADTEIVDRLRIEARLDYEGCEDQATFKGLKLECPFGRILQEEGRHCDGRDFGAGVRGGDAERRSGARAS